jgi:hypothetical protein
MIKQNSQMNIKIRSEMKEDMAILARTMGMGLTSIMKYAAFMVLHNIDNDEILADFQASVIEYNKTEEELEIL